MESYKAGKLEYRVRCVRITSQDHIRHPVPDGSGWNIEPLLSKLSSHSKDWVADMYIRSICGATNTGSHISWDAQCGTVESKTSQTYDCPLITLKMLKTTSQLTQSVVKERYIFKGEAQHLTLPHSEGEPSCPASCRHICYSFPLTFITIIIMLMFILLIIILTLIISVLISP